MWLSNIIWQRITIVLNIKLFDYLRKGIFVCLKCCLNFSDILNCTSIIVCVHVVSGVSFTRLPIALLYH